MKLPGTGASSATEGMVKESREKDRRRQERSRGDSEGEDGSKRRRAIGQRRKWRGDSKGKE